MSKGKPLAYCQTCGSEIVETINDSLFREGECDACEYARYKTHPDLLETLVAIKNDCDRWFALQPGEMDADDLFAAIQSAAARAVARAEGRA